MESSGSDLRAKVKGLYDKIKQDFYLCRDDLTLGKDSFNSVLLFGTLTQINRGNQLLFGEYGGGKTTSAEYLNSIFNNIPLDLVRRVAIRGNPQLTDEKVVGRPHYGLLQEGQEKVVWQHFVLIGPKIIDEFNRIPESNQALTLNGVDRGEWNYLNDFVSTSRQPFFATCNYSDRGNNDLIPPILDRFDVAVESKFPGVAQVVNSISQDYYNERDSVLRNTELTKEALKILSSGDSYEVILDNMASVSDRHRTKMAAKGLDGLSLGEREILDSEIQSIPLDANAEKYFAFLVSELNVSPKYGQKRSIDSLTNEFGLYLSAYFIGSGSRRAEKSIVRYAKSLAWLQNEDEVGLEHVSLVAPYALWHRMKWNDEISSRFKESYRDDPFDLFLTKTVLGSGTKEFPGVKSRFVQSHENYQRVLDLIASGNIDSAKNEAQTFSASGRGHPIFLDILKDL